MAPQIAIAKLSHIRNSDQLFDYNGPIKSSGPTPESFQLFHFPRLY
jgi:hypothetical protein